MTQFTKDDVYYFAKFARLAMTDSEAESYASRLSDMIGFADALKEVDTENVGPMTHPLKLINVLREDIPTDRLDREEMLKSVKEHEAGMIKVPNIL
ncbi:Asp-tRNA(Asn)/Glu-tRNA(Gln) amidotransferase subunit GatC [Sporosarcina limicola]|uniref:Aspartyl/glutamyl-tRNA(Asn/Gln) amidotransferase subunit C n=1 Tax=Sporosarcina limicola TaxID=34101 RepID=A0A927MJU1_9BACL|nr:Asp-tRNA(Asn)/Glu-tRNA(Gln) amidotransferase subunit GatC [Sporosarcina limicola]MBE1556025.1 aspartyl-tRNA(Asn)/glutamyl-tRNA(Gln) amidotransferase subunit C [Sporosarcina limicola]